MAGTTMVAFKSKMVELISAMPEFDGVKVSYADPGDKALKENVWFQRITLNDVEPVALRTGRRRRDETYQAELVIEVSGTRLTPERAEARSLELGLHIEEYLADNPKLDGSLPDLITALMLTQRLSCSETDQGPTAIHVLTIEVRARLL